MHGPDGTDYQNKFIYDEIVMPERIAYSHISGPQFRAIVTFDDQNNKTKVTVRMIFESAEERDNVVKKYGAIEGLNQNLGRLEQQLAKVSEVGRSAGREFTTTRVFDAPRDIMWKTWTESDRLMQWWGPKGFMMLSCKLDLRPGGAFHYHLRSPDGSDMWGKFAYREIVRPERLVFVVSFSDKDGNTTHAPFSGDWPLEILSIVTFAEYEGRTKITVKWTPLNATEEERRGFEAGHESMKHGFTGTFEKLAEYLKRY